MDGKQIFAGIEVADHEVRLVIGEFFNTRFNIIKVERVPCDGITYNEVINPEAVTAAVVTAVSDAKKMIVCFILNLIVLYGCFQHGERCFALAVDVFG